MESTPDGPLSFSLDGNRLEGVRGDTVASALLRAGVTTFTRSIKYHRPRGPFCLSGSCGQCLMRIDGVPSLLACRVRLREGMQCARQNAPLGADADVLRAADFLFPEHLDHHHLMVHSRLLGRVALEVARRLAGLGELPDAVQPRQPAALREEQIVVVGGGPAGISAAIAAAHRGARVLLLERDDRPGGAALLGVDPDAPGVAWVNENRRALVDANVEVALDAEVVGIYPNDAAAAPRKPALLAVRRPAGLVAVLADAVVVATGGVSQPLPFAGVDRPGVHAARGLLALALEQGVRVGTRLCVVGEGRELVDASRALQRAGYVLARIVDASGAWPVPSGEVTPTSAPDLPLMRARELRARGNPVRELRAGDEAIACDAVAVALPPAPAHELASQAGAHAQFSPELGGFAIAADASGRTSVPWLFVAGRVAGASGSRASESGARAGVGCADSLGVGRP
ncbi:MAG TPA: FAD-dependent oxidoreductase [Myxococcales bacterium]|jgi:sarcosine oxidase subunit alpha|nr:FAD-dependent oxidoreductase [Myxococcales bacterium]